MDPRTTEPPADDVATVALANKSARVAWALMKYECEYDHGRARAA
jgi:hypothetical protein